MRIALILPGFSAHSKDWAIPARLTLARHLAREHDLHIFSQRYPLESGRSHFDGFTHHALGGGQNFGLSSIKIWLKSAQAIIRQHRKTPFDILHAFWADEAGFSAALAGQWIKRPVIVSLSGGELAYFPEIEYGAQRFFSRRQTIRFALNRANIVTAGSNYQIELCQQHKIPTYKLHLAPLGVDTMMFQRPTKNDQSINNLKTTPTLIQVASLLSVKNQSFLLQTLRLVKEQIPHIKLNLVGRGPLKENLISLAEELDLTSNIIWHDYVFYPNLPKIYQESHLYIQTSHHEGQGMSVLEALACGIPILGTPVGVVRDLACDTPTYKPEVLAQQVLDILCNPHNYQNLSDQSHKVAQEMYNMNTTVNKFYRLYTSLI